MLDFFALIEEPEIQVTALLDELVELLITMGLSPSRSIRLSLSGDCYLTPPARDALELAGFEVSEDFSNTLKVVDDLDSVALSRSPWVYPRWDADPTRTLLKATGVLNLAMGWAGSPPRPDAQQLLCNMLTRRAPTTDLPRLLKRSEWCDSSAKRFTELIAQMFNPCLFN